MTKEKFQQELLEKVKEGVKPSTLKKSKSDSDLPQTKIQPLKHSQSTTDIPLIEPTELEDKISVLELKLETKDRELADKDETIREFSKALQKADEEIKATKQELDNSLQARYEAVKQFGKLAQKLKALRKELAENLTQSTDELINQDQTITKLRTQQQQAQTKIQELERDLNLATKLAQVRKYPLPTNSPNLDYSRVALYVGISVLTIWLLTKNNHE